MANLTYETFFETAIIVAEILLVIFKTTAALLTPQFSSVFLLTRYSTYNELRCTSYIRYISVIHVQDN